MKFTPFDIHIFLTKQLLLVNNICMLVSGILKQRDGSLERSVVTYLPACLRVSECVRQVLMCEMQMLQES
jgi:hypothetical protein